MNLLERSNSLLLTLKKTMIVRIIGAAIGVLLLLCILFLRGLPVLFFIKMVPLVLLLVIAASFLYAAFTSD